MSTTLGEKLGVALAFIPGVSTVIGIIKAVNYSNRSVKSLENERESFEVEKVKNTAKQLIFSKTADCENTLYRVSLVQLIPGINIIAAFVELYLLSKMSELRKPDIYTKHFGVEPLSNPIENKMFSDTLHILDTVDLLSSEKKQLAQILRGNCSRLNDNEKPEVRVKFFMQSRLNEVTAAIEKNTAELQKLEADKHKAQSEKYYIQIDGEIVQAPRKSEPSMLTEMRERNIKYLKKSIQNYEIVQSQLARELAKMNPL